MVLLDEQRTPFARFHFLSFGERDARRLVSRLLYDVGSAAEPEIEPRHQLGLTARGLEKLGLVPSELAQFPLEFRQGMQHPERALALGDEPPSGVASLDAVWLSFAPSAEHRAERAAEHERSFERFDVAWSSSDAEWVPNQNPHVRRKRWQRRPLALGELVLGQVDAVGVRASGPFVAAKSATRALPPWRARARALDFGHDGSFLVLRRLQAVSDESARALVREFTQRMSCRAYRSSQRPNHPTELWIAALNVDIRRQFELAQQEHTSSAVRDGGQSEIAIAGADIESRSPGGYFFLPSLRSLNYLAEPGA